MIISSSKFLEFFSQWVDDSNRPKHSVNAMIAWSNKKQQEFKDEYNITVVPDAHPKPIYVAGGTINENNKLAILKKYEDHIRDTTRHSM